MPLTKVTGGEFSGDITVNSQYVTGVSTVINGPLLVGSGTSTGTASQRLQVTGGAYVSNNLGVGVTNPTANLDISGDIRVRGGLYDKDNQPGSVGQILVSTGSGIDWVNTAPVESSVAITVYDDGSIVGTANSISQLNFVGNVVSATGSAGVGIATITFLDYISNSGVSTSVIGGIGSISQLSVSGITTTGLLNVGTGGTIFTTTGIGSVGIGTTQPSTNLHVYNTSSATQKLESADTAGYSQFEVKSGIGTTAISGLLYSSSLEGGVILRNNSNTTGTLAFAGTPSSGIDLAIFRETRNVVIGNNPSAASQTGTANQKLQVQSGAYVSGNLGIGITNPFSDNGTNVHINSTGTARLWLQSTTAVTGRQYYLESLGSSGALTFVDGTVGLERVRIDSSGRLLIGTTTANNNARFEQKLSIVHAGSNTFAGLNITGYSGTNPLYAPNIDLQRSRGTTDGSFTEVASGDALGYITFRGADGVGWSDAAFIGSYADGDWTTSGDTTDSPGSLIFGTTADGAAGPTERMRITSAGLMGLGTNAPTSTLTVAGDAKIGPSGDTNGYLTIDGATNVYLALTATNGYIGADSNLLFCTNSTATERARIDSSGRLLINTSTNLTGSVLQVSQTNDLSSTTLDLTTAGGITLTSSSNSNNFGAGLWFEHGSLRAGMASSRINTANWGTDLRFYTHPDSTDNQYQVIERMRITSDGRLGVNAQNPGASLEVLNSGSGNAIVSRFTRNNGADLHWLEIIVNPDTDTVKLSSTGSANGSIILGTAAVDALTTTNQGLVGIGTTVPTSRIHVFGGGGANTEIKVSSSATSDAGFISSTSLGSYKFGTGIGNASKCWNVYDIDAAASRILIDSNGNFGVGTNSPGALLDVRQDANAVSQQIRLTNTNSVGTVGSAIKFQGFYDTALISSDGVPAFTTGGSLSLQTYSSNGVLNAGIHITRTGLVGIGTTVPGASLHVSGTVPESWVASGTNTLVTGAWDGTTHYIKSINLGTAFTPLTFQATSYIFQSSTTEVVRISGDGNLLIGQNTNPLNYKFIVNTGSGSNNYAAVFTNNVDAGLDIRLTSGVSLINAGTGTLALGTSNTERARITSDGKMGLGTNSPTERLDLGGGVSDTIKIRFSMGGNVATIGSVGSGVANGLGNLAFFTRDGSFEQERMRITSDGKVGIGTNAPTAALDVVGNIELGTKGAYNNTTFIDITTDTTYTDYGFRIIRGGIANGNTQLISRGTGALELNCVDGGYASVSTNNTERVRITSDGRMLVGTSSQPSTGGTLCVADGIGIVNTTTAAFATVEHGSGSNGTFTTITISATVQTTVASVIFETLMTGFSGVYLDNVSAKYSDQASVTMRNNASVGTSAALTVNGSFTTFTLTITTSVTHPVVKVKVTAGGLAGAITLPTITFA